MIITGKILIVDDDQAIRHTLARILQSAGLDATSAESGEQGLAFLEATRFDLVLMDIRMPSMSGLQVLDLIQTHFPGTPVVLFTAEPDLDSAVEALRHGATDYLLKPLKPEIVIERAQKILLSQYKERRKREIQAQIEALQTELSSLDHVPVSAATPVPTTPASERYLKRGELMLDIYTRRVTIREKSVDLLPTSFNILLVLARHAPEVVDFQTLVAEAQGYQTDFHEAQELVKWHIHQIRQAIEPDPRNPRYVINVRRTGYRLVTD